jgi:hypothetical protein
VPTITPTANANSVWNGTFPADALSTGITSYVLYCAQGADTQKAYRRVKEYANPGAGTVTLGPLTYPRLFLDVPTRTFYLRVTAKKGAQEEDFVSVVNPALMVVVSEVKGWTIEQIMAQEMRPAVIVGYDPVNKLFYPVNVVASGSGTGYMLET